MLVRIFNVAALHRWVKIEWPYYTLMSIPHAMLRNTVQTEQPESIVSCFGAEIMPSGKRYAVVGRGRLSLALSPGL